VVGKKKFIFYVENESNTSQVHGLSCKLYVQNARVSRIELHGF
jgi:hypothetical protein